MTYQQSKEALKTKYSLQYEYKTFKLDAGSIRIEGKERGHDLSIRAWPRGEAERERSGKVDPLSPHREHSSMNLPRAVQPVVI